MTSESIRSISCPMSREGLAKIRVLVTLRQQLGESLDRDERILDLVGHPGGKRAQAGQPIAPPNLHLETLQRGDVGQHHERAQQLAILPVENRTARADHDRAQSLEAQRRFRDSPGARPSGSVSFEISRSA